MIWTLSKQELCEIVKKSNSIAQVLKILNLGKTGAGHSVLKKRMIFDEIDFSHMKMGISSNKGRKFQRGMSKEEAISELFVENCGWDAASLRKYVRKFNLLPYECVNCLNKGDWKGKELQLQLDHVNGNNKDNRMGNVRYLCPNCHSQTKNFSGRNKKT